MPALIDAVVAVTPLAFIAVVALPVACIRERFTDIAKDSDFLPFLRVVLAHERMRRR
jgi:hypothetical protein